MKYARFFFLVAALTAGVVAVLADSNVPINTQPYYPQWWYQYNLVDPTWSGPVNNYAPVNIGQLKNVAYAAKLYLDAQLASVGGSDIAGTTVGGQVIANFSVYNGSSPNVNYAPVNIGQLKSVAQHFYDRLNVVGYNVTADLEAHGYPAPSGGNYTYPWPTPPPALGQTGYNATVYNAWAQGEYAPANLGQLKAVFDFDLTNFTPSPLDANGIRSSWEIAVYGNLTTLNSSNWLTEDITSGNTSIPDYKNASVTSPAILTVTITYPANGTAFN